MYDNITITICPPSRRKASSSIQKSTRKSKSSGAVQVAAKWVAKDKEDGK